MVQQIRRMYGHRDTYPCRCRLGYGSQVYVYHRVDTGSTRQQKETTEMGINTSPAHAVAAVDGVCQADDSDKQDGALQSAEKIREDENLLHLVGCLKEENDGLVMRLSEAVERQEILEVFNQQLKHNLSSLASHPDSVYHQMGPCTTDTEKELEKMKKDRLFLDMEMKRLREENSRLLVGLPPGVAESAQPEPQPQPQLQPQSQSISQSQQLQQSPGSLPIAGAIDAMDVTQMLQAARFTEQISALEEELSESQNQLLTMRTDFAENLVRQEAERRSAVNRLKCDLESEIESLHRRCHQQEGDKLQSVANAKRELQGEIAKLNETILVQQDEKANALESVRCELESEIAKQNNVLLLFRKMAVRVQTDFLGLQETCNNLRETLSTWPYDLHQQMTEFNSQVSWALTRINQQTVVLTDKYHREMKLRKMLHNEIIELKGSIRVFCRVRPWIKEDGESETGVVVTCDPVDTGLLSILNKGGRNQDFLFDRVFDDSSTQSEVFEEVSMLIKSVMDGYNVCIFAYGQTGSGKTHTMEGRPEDPGINQRALHLLFEESRDESWNYDIKASVLEIYNESIRDLLNSDPSNKLDVRLKQEGGLHVPGLVQVNVTSLQEINEVFATGRKNRATAATNLNEHSSRSHCLLCVRVTGENRVTGSKVFGRLNLVDLAGSERIGKSQVDGARLKEAQSINKSLACLGDVIQALSNRHSHVPFRNSKLTYLLQDSLGGNSKTLMIIQVSSVERHVLETICTLSFGQRVRMVELGAAAKNGGSPKRSPLSSKKPVNFSLLEIPEPVSASTSPKSSPRSSLQESPIEMTGHFLSIRPSLIHRTSSAPSYPSSSSSSASSSSIRGHAKAFNSSFSAPTSTSSTPPLVGRRWSGGRTSSSSTRSSARSSPSQSPLYSPLSSPPVSPAKRNAQTGSCSARQMTRPVSPLARGSRAKMAVESKTRKFSK